MESRKAIIMLAETFQPAYIREIANALSRRGLRVTVVGSRIHEEQEYQPGVQVLSLRGALKPGRSFLARAAELMSYYLRCLRLVAGRSERVVYHAGIGKPFLSCVLLYGALKLLGRRIVHTVHNLLPHDSSTLKNRLLHYLIYHLTTDYLVAHSAHMKARIVRHFHVSPAKIIVAAHGTYTVPAGTGCDRSPARRRLGFAEEDFLLLLFGQQRPYKGTHFLLEAVGRSDYKVARIVIRGEARDGYGAKLASIIRRYSLGSLVDCDLRYVDDEQMRLLFEASDAVVLPYLEGSQSGVMFMAFALGRPVIASDLEGLAEAILPGRTGETFAPGDAGALIGAIDKVARNRDAYEEDFIRNYARKHYSWDSCASSLCTNIFDKVDGAAKSLEPQPPRALR